MTHNLRRAGLLPYSSFQSSPPIILAILPLFPLLVVSIFRPVDVFPSRSCFLLFYYQYPLLILVTCIVLMFSMSVAIWALRMQPG